MKQEYPRRRTSLYDLCQAMEFRFRFSISSTHHVIYSFHPYIPLTCGSASVCHVLLCRVNMEIPWPPRILEVVWDSCCGRWESSNTFSLHIVAPPKFEDPVNSRSVLRVLLAKNCYFLSDFLFRIWRVSSNLSINIVSRKKIISHRWIIRQKQSTYQKITFSVSPFCKKFQINKIPCLYSPSVKMPAVPPFRTLYILDLSYVLL